MEDSEPDWPELMRALDEIDSGLQMTDLPLSEIGSYFESESDRLQSEKQELQTEKTELQNERERLQLEKSSLDERERELNAREQGLDERESLYSGMQVDLDRATAALRRSKILGIIVAIIVGAGVGYAGYRIGRAVNY